MNRCRILNKKPENHLPAERLPARQGRQANLRSETMPGYIFVISGPSGSGKTTLAEKIIKGALLKNKIKKGISFTTRPKRSNERDKKDYFFITEEQFKQNLRAKKILEWTKYLGYYYGTFREFMDEQIRRGMNVLLCVDLKGAARLKRFYPSNTVTIFIMPPSFEELRERIEKRCSEIKRREVHMRVKLARKEVLSAANFDYCVVNKNLGKTVKQLKDIILIKIRKR